MNLTGIAMDWLIWLVAQWWFYPVAVFYMIIGYWFGILNYWVAKKSDCYGYWIRFFLYPLTTVCREGWGKASYGTIVSGDESSSISNSNTFTAARFFEDVFIYQLAELYYATLLAVSWGIKVFVNISVITVLVASSLIIWVCAVVLMAACFIWGLFVSGSLQVVNWGRSIFSVARPAMDEGGGTKTEVK